MKQTLKGFICADEVPLFVGDPHEMVLFLQTSCQVAGIDPDIEDTAELISTLDEQVKVLFSKELMLSPVDADTMMPATKRSEEIFIAITPINDITVH
jgi:hypothetical protein